MLLLYHGIVVYGENQKKQKILDFFIMLNVSLTSVVDKKICII